MKNPLIGERVRNKTGFKDEGNIIKILPDGKNVSVIWHLQDCFETSESYPMKNLERVKPRTCPTCGKPLN
jgi:hypothetical protein